MALRLPRAQRWAARLLGAVGQLLPRGRQQRGGGCRGNNVRPRGRRRAGSAKK
jgi:hypothetical protein